MSRMSYCMEPCPLESKKEKERKGNGKEKNELLNWSKHDLISWLRAPSHVSPCISLDHKQTTNKRYESRFNNSMDSPRAIFVSVSWTIQRKKKEKKKKKGKILLLKSKE